jgi:hypothetical protein
MPCGAEHTHKIYNGIAIVESDSERIPRSLLRGSLFIVSVDSPSFVVTGNDVIILFTQHESIPFLHICWGESDIIRN